MLTTAKLANNREGVRNGQGQEADALDDPAAMHLSNDEGSEVKVILKQAEIEQAIRDYVFKQINVRDGQDVSIDLSATRGQAGFTATIDIRADGSQPAPVTQPQPQT
jgi:hypothetical protein